MSTAITVSERERAKQIITELIRQAGGMLTCKTELVRVFWRAHLVYAECHPGYLSLWPLLKTPAGPVIKEVDLLLGELVADGVLQIEETTAGGEPALRLELAECAAGAADMPRDAVEAIQQAIDSPSEPLNVADHSSLRSWNEAADGQELNIYLDAIPDAEYRQRVKRLQNDAAALKSVWD